MFFRICISLVKIIVSSPIHMLANFIMLLILTSVKESVVSMSHIFSIHFPVNVDVEGFQFLAISNKVPRIIVDQLS